MPPPTSVASPDPAVVVSSRPRRTRRATLVVGLIGCIALLVLVTLLSIAVGTKQIPLPTVIDALRHYSETDTDHAIVHSLCVPRTVIGLLVGPPWGSPGAADAGRHPQPAGRSRHLGVNAGAALAVVAAIAGLGSP